MATSNFDEQIKELGNVNYTEEQAKFLMEYYHAEKKFHFYKNVAKEHQDLYTNQRFVLLFHSSRHVSHALTIKVLNDEYPAELLAKLKRVLVELATFVLNWEIEIDEVDTNLDEESFNFGAKPSDQV